MKMSPEEEQAIDALLAITGTALDASGYRNVEISPSDKSYVRWQVAIDAWRDDGFAALITILVNGLRDADGAELPPEARAFFLELIAQKTKTRKRRSTPDGLIRRFYPYLLAEEQKKDPSQREGVEAHRKVKEDLAKIFGVTYTAVDMMVSRRASRQLLKRGPHQP